LADSRLLQPPPLCPEYVVEMSGFSMLGAPTFRPLAKERATEIKIEGSL